MSYVNGDFFARSIETGIVLRNRLLVSDNRQIGLQCFSCRPPGLMLRMSYVEPSSAITSIL